MANEITATKWKILTKSEVLGTLRLDYLVGTLFDSIVYVVIICIPKQVKFLVLIKLGLWAQYKATLVTDSGSN